MATQELKILQPGDLTKSDPYTIAIVSNPVLELGENSGNFVIDPIVRKKTSFYKCVSYIVDCIFGNLPGQEETFLSDPAIFSKIRVVSLFVNGLAANDQNSLVYVKNWLIARSDVFGTFLRHYNVAADVVFAISATDESDAATAWATDDDDNKDGVDFIFDGIKYCHRYYYKTPGTIAMHVTNRRMTAIHEFGHAASSYTNGYLTDLYVDGFAITLDETAVFNKKFERPIPSKFATLNKRSYDSDRTRDHLGYPAEWESYHPSLINDNFPAIMDNYNLAAARRYEKCQHDEITRKFLLDRIRAKTLR